MSRLVCRHIVAANNWLVLNRPSSPSAALPPWSNQQRMMLCRLERWAAVWLRLGRGPKSGLGRSVQKLQSISDQIFSLHSMSQRLFSELQPYSKAARGAEEPTPAPEPPVFSESVAASRAAPVTSNMAIEPSRLNFEEAPKFVANRFLTDPLLRAGLQDPRAFRLPSCQWPRPKLARVHCNRQKQLELFRKWDNVHCLHLIRASDSEYRFRCGLFAVYKSEAVDRQMLNPIPENSRSFSVSEATHTLAHSSLLCQLYIPRNQALTISSDDLTDFYHGFLVDASHAARNHLHGVFKGEEFAGWNCFRTELLGTDVVGCFRTLAMGTNYAVEVAQHAHGVLLYRAGCLREHERIAYRSVFPKGPGFDMLCIDDHVFLLLVNLSEVGRTPSPNRRDAKLFAQAGEAYLRAGLRVSAKKKVRNVTQATVLGGELDGLRGDLAAPRLRTAALGGLTFQLVLLGYCTKDLLQCIVGCWVFICMFRRPFMCLMTQVYHEMKNRAGNEVFKLSHDARQELLMLVLLSPCMFTDLRAPPLDRIFCTDASGYAAGACHSYISRSACLDLLHWYADHKGYHTALLPKSAELGARLGDQDGFASLHQDLPPQLDEGVIFDFMEVFQGESRLTQVAVEMGLRVHPSFDIMGSQGLNILSSACFDQVVGLVCRRVVAYVHLGPHCSSFGTMCRPHLRDRRAPFGFNPDDPRTKADNRMALRVAFVLSLAASYGILGSAEQPVGSMMFSLDAFKKLATSGYHSVKVAFCNYGTPFERYTCWLVNNPSLLQLRAKCACPLKGRHLRLESSFTQAGVKTFGEACRPDAFEVFGREPRVGEPLCRYSRSYPISLCKQILELQLPSIQLLHRKDDGLRQLHALDDSFPVQVFTREPHQHKRGAFIPQLDQASGQSFSGSQVWCSFGQPGYHRVQHEGTLEQCKVELLLEHQPSLHCRRQPVPLPVPCWHS